MKPMVPDTQKAVLAKLPFETPMPSEIKHKAHIDAIVDSREVPFTHITTRIGGLVGHCTWYSQVVGSSEELRPPSIGGSSTTNSTQSYNKIDKLELRFESDFDFGADGNNNEVTLTGSAVTLPKFTPNKYDVFIMDIGDGRSGVFTVTDSVPLSIYREKAHRISFELNSSGKKELTDYLERCTVGKFKYIVDYLRLGRTPIVAEENFVLIEELKRARTNLISNFLREFFDYEHRTLILTHKGRKVYDPLMTKAFLQLVGSEEDPILSLMRQRNPDEDNSLKAPTIWDRLVYNDKERFKVINDKMIVLHRNQFYNLVHNHGVRYSSLDYVVFPQKSLLASSNAYEKFYSPEKIELQIVIDRFILQGLGDYVPVPDETLYSMVDGRAKEKLLNSIDQDEYYIFSVAFYKGRRRHMSRIELMVEDMFERINPNGYQLIEIINKLDELTPLDRYYYSPVLIALLNYHIIVSNR